MEVDLLQLNLVVDHSFQDCVGLCMAMPALSVHAYMYIASGNDNPTVPCTRPEMIFEASAHLVSSKGGRVCWKRMEHRPNGDFLHQVLVKKYPCFSFCLPVR